MNWFVIEGEGGVFFIVRDVEKSGEMVNFFFGNVGIVM